MPQPLPAREFMFHGKWLVRYEPAEIHYPDILLTLARIQDVFKDKNINFNSINILFNNSGNKNCFYKEKDNIYLNFCSLNNDFEEINTKPCVPVVIKPLEKPIMTISLLFPRLENDPRWKTMGLPAAQLLMAANLQALGFEPAPMFISLPGATLPPGALQTDMAGVTVFEDLLPSLRPFLARFKAVHSGWLAAGGPFPTLAPLAAVFHLPQVNLFVRGEAEMVLPAILDALNRGDSKILFKHKGVFWQQPGLIVMVDFEQINRPENFSGFQADLSFLQAQHLAHGLEMNFSRGCGRGCLFCCRVQGNTFRKLPLEKIDELLKKYTQQIEKSIEKSKSPNQEPHPSRSRGFNQEQSYQIPTLSRGDKGGIEISGSESGRVTNPPLREPGPSSTERLNSHLDSKLAYTVNINDDDILQDPAYAAAVFALVKKHGFRIHGIQTSPAALIGVDGRPAEEVLDLAADPGLFIEGRPLLWLGTDVFLPARARRLGKKLPPAEKFVGLLAAMEKRGLRHFHYWISSDLDSTWEEFIDELSLISRYHRDFPNFGLLAHAPFIVPYPASRMFERLPAGDPKLKLKLELHAPDPRFSYSVVERLETKHVNLNKLLNNEKAGGEFGFFDLLKAKDFMATAQLAYHFLKQEELQKSVSDPNLLKAKGKLEKFIGDFLELDRSSQ